MIRTPSGLSIKVSRASSFSPCSKCHPPESQMKYLSVQSFQKYLLSAPRLPDIVLGTKDKQKTYVVPVPLELLAQSPNRCVLNIH